MEIKHLEVLHMPNDELLCLGKTVGWGKDFAKFLHPVESHKWQCPEDGIVVEADYEQIADNGNPVCECGADMERVV